MMKKGLLAISILVALLAIGSQASADPIGPVCSNESCFGNVYTLSFAELTPTNFQIKYELDTATTTLPATSFVGQIAFKVTSSSSDIAGASLLGTNAPGVWALTSLGGLNNSGCTSGPQGFLCAADGTFSALTDGSKYTWLFDVQVNSASDWKLAPFDASIKANFGPQNGLLTSEDITLQGGRVPEPASLMLLGAGLAGIGLSQWKRRKAGQA